MNCTVNGTVPLVEFCVKEAIGFGGSSVYVTVTDVSLVLSDVSKTRAAIMFEPGARFTDRVHELVPDAVIHEPEPTLTSTILSPTLSAAVPVTVIVSVLKF